MTVSGVALKMQLELKQLRQRHRVAPTGPRPVALSEPTPGPMILRGLASTSDIDLTQTRFRSYAFGWPLRVKAADIPLLHKHGQIAGLIEALEYDGSGSLLVRVRAEHEEARRCNAFSVGARILKYELKDTDSPQFYALVTSAELSEVSLTNIPAIPHALVRTRYAALPDPSKNFAKMHDVAICLRDLVGLLMNNASVQASSPRAASPKHAGFTRGAYLTSGSPDTRAVLGPLPPAQPSERERAGQRTSFGELVAHMNARAA